MRFLILICIYFVICTSEEPSNYSIASGGFVDMPWDTHVYKESISIQWNSTYIQLYGLPHFLNGTLYRNTPAIWRYPERTEENNPHWFDGLAMLHSFKFLSDPNNDAISIVYCAKFVNSSTYNQYNPNSNYTPTEESWNTDVTIRRINGDILLTNTGEIQSNSFSIDNLSTIEAPYHYDDNIYQSGTTNAPSHVQYDPDTNELFHFYYNWGEQSNYVLYHIKPNTNTRIIANNSLIPINKLKIPLYQHSFGLTKGYLIMCEQPMVAMAGSHEYWISDMNVTWYIVDRYNGKLIKTFISTPFSYYHFINCYESDNDTVIVDLVYDDNDGKVFDSLYLNNIVFNWQGFMEEFARSHPLRFVFNMNDNNNNNTLIEGKLLTNRNAFELPTLNNKYNTKNYKYMYGLSAFNLNTSQFMDTIIKIDVTNNDLDNNYKIWHSLNEFPGEPLFVNTDKELQEDDGILLSVIFNANNNSSYLLILNATDLTEIGRAQSTQISHVPVGFHGRYYHDL